MAPNITRQDYIINEHVNSHAPPISLSITAFHHPLELTYQQILFNGMVQSFMHEARRKKQGLELCITSNGRSGLAEITFPEWSEEYNAGTWQHPLIGFTLAKNAEDLTFSRELARNIRYARDHIAAKLPPYLQDHRYPSIQNTSTGWQLSYTSGKETTIHETLTDILAHRCTAEGILDYSLAVAKLESINEAMCRQTDYWDSPAITLCASLRERGNQLLLLAEKYSPIFTSPENRAIFERLKAQLYNGKDTYTLPLRS